MTASLAILVGIPGAGKSTFIAHSPDFTKLETWSIVSSDRIREELTGEISNQDSNGEVFDTLYERVRTHLSNGWPVVVDATNLQPDYRSNLMAIAKELGVQATYAYLFLASNDFELCQERNLARHDRFEPVPENVMRRFYDLFQQNCSVETLTKEGWKVKEVKE